METAVRTPLEIFNLPQHLVIPLFQRPYVWKEESQWMPLWQDIRRMAELRIGQPSSGASHFLGAVVLQAGENQAGTLQPRSIIDGQQRLTTLQLVLDATAAAFEARDMDQLAAQLRGLTHNASHFVQPGEPMLKLRHTNRDQVAFDEVMDADPPVDYDNLRSSGSLIAAAHRYFFAQVDSWLGEDDCVEQIRADALAGVVTRGLQLVVIDLRFDENSQEIFETLNARGTPLTAADLIKNFVFQRLTNEGVDTAKVYAEQWPFDTNFWERSVSVGRYTISRSSVFLNQWLISRVGEEIGPTSTFSRFKHYVEHEAGQSMVGLLATIKKQAAAYESWTLRAADPHAALDRVELSVYRMQAVESESLKPFLLWLHAHGGSYSRSEIDLAIGAAESWLMRRSLLRLTMSDAGRVVAELVQRLKGAPDDLSVSVTGYFARLDAASTYWPGDAELRRRLADEPVYRRFKRGRLRMFLEVAEDHLRGFTESRPSLTGSRVPRLSYHIEHLMPQKWADHWPVADVTAGSDRDGHIHRLGNLTLLTSSLNSKVSNGPWLGSNGKRAKLAEHDVLLLNRKVREAAEDGWREELIDRRTESLVEAFIATWPIPDGHTGEVRDRAATDAASITIKDLIDAGMLPIGTVLTARQGSYGNAKCEVLATGDLAMDGKAYSSPSAAGHAVRRGATNGWWFWHLPDGRRLKDLRTELAVSRT